MLFVRSKSHKRSMSPEDEACSPPLGFSYYSEDVPQRCVDLDRSQESGIRSRARSCCHMGTPEAHITWWDIRHKKHLNIQPFIHLYNFLSPCYSISHRDYASENSPFLKILMDAEAAANSAAVQLVSFKDAMEDEYTVCSLHFFIKIIAWRSRLKVSFWHSQYCFVCSDQGF